MVEFAQRRMVQQGLDPSTPRSRGTGITSGLMPEGKTTFFQQVPFDPKKFEYVPNVREPVSFGDLDKQSVAFQKYMIELDQQEEEQIPENETPKQMQERINRRRQRVLDSSRPLSSRQAEEAEGITSLLRESMGQQMPSNLEAGIMATGEAIQQLNRNLDNAKDLPDVMNAVRGDNKTIAERKDELAGLVGTEDAQRTPDSVLAVMQPFFQILDVVQAQASPGGIADLPMDEPKGAR